MLSWFPDLKLPGSVCAPPQIRVQQSPFAQTALAQFKAGASQEGIHRRDGSGRETSDDSEEAIHRRDDPARAPACEAVRGDLEVRNDPVRSFLHGGRQARHERGKLIGTKAIEEEIRDNEIEALRGRGPREDVRVNVFDATAAMASEDFHAPPRLPQHGGARVEDGDVRGAIYLHQFAEKTSIAFTEQQNVLCKPHLIEKGCPASLQFASGQQPFHPAIMRRERVEAHDMSGPTASPVRQQTKDAAAPIV